jgi:hypothetical protein
VKVSSKRLSPSNRIQDCNEWNKSAVNLNALMFLAFKESSLSSKEPAMASEIKEPKSLLRATLKSHEYGAFQSVCRAHTGSAQETTGDCSETLLFR